VALRKPLAIHVLALALGAGVLAGCVDHDANAQTFCERNAELLDPGSDEAVYSEDQAIYFSDEVEKTMRFAEDGTRDIRRTARRLADAYADVREISDDDDVPEDEFDEVYGELRKRRAEMRDVCAETVGETGGDEEGDQS
jgi:hypothetical protein